MSTASRLCFNRHLLRHFHFFFWCLDVGDFLCLFRGQIAFFYSVYWAVFDGYFS